MCKFKGRWNIYLEHILSGTKAGGIQKQRRDVENIIKYLLPECQLIHFVQGINSRECKTI